jgi:hypothetical protein
LIFAPGLAIIADAFPRAERGRALGLNAVVFRAPHLALDLLYQPARRRRGLHRFQSRARSVRSPNARTA